MSMLVHVTTWACTFLNVFLIFDKSKNKLFSINTYIILMRFVFYFNIIILGGEI